MLRSREVPENQSDADGSRVFPIRAGRVEGAIRHRGACTVDDAPEAL